MPRTLLALLLVLTACGAQQREPVVPQPVQGPDLGRALTAGGLVLFVRAPDGAELAAQDRQHAEQVGEGLAGLRAAPSRVLSGPAPAESYARVAFGAATRTAALEPLEPTLGHAEVGRTAGAALQLLTRPPGEGRTTVLVGHGGTLEVIAGVRLEQGAVAVFRPDGQGDVLLVGVVEPGEWSDLR